MSASLVTFSKNRNAYRFAVALLFCVGAFQRFRLPRSPLSDPDIWGYLNPAVAKLSGGVFQHTDGRNFLYPGFLFLILAATKHFGAIALVQHLFGLGTGALLLACWEKLRGFLRAIPGAVHSLGGLIVAALYLLSLSSIVFEQEIRPEAITPFFALLNILLTLAFFQERSRRGPSPRLSLIAAALLVNSVLLVTLKTSFAISVLFSAVPVLVALFDRRETWRRRLAVLAVGAAAVAAVTLPERAFAQTDPYASALVPEALFTIHANLIVRQMDEDLARGDCPPRGCEWLRGIDTSLHEELAKSWAADKRYRSFGFNPDYLLYEPSSLRAWTGPYFEGNYDRQVSFYDFYYWRTLRNHPDWMLAKTISQLGLFYSLGNPAFAAPRKAALAPLYRKSEFCLQAHSVSEGSWPPLARYLKHCSILGQTQAVIAQPRIVSWVNGFLAHLYLPLLLGVIAVAVALLFRAPWRTSHGRFACITLFLFSYNFGNSLGTALVHSLHIQRYSTAQYSFALLATGGALFFLADFFLFLCRRTEARA